jgi:hypothetical protein
MYIVVSKKFKCKTPMGLLNGLFNRKMLNLLDEITRKFETEEKKKVLLDSPFLNKRQLVLNHNAIYSFVLAVFYFERIYNPLFKEVRLKKEYAKIIEEAKNNKTFQVFYNSMVDYYKGNPNLDKALWNITYAYLDAVWGIEKGAKDPILLTVYSTYLTEVRGTIKTEIVESLSIIADKQPI